MPAGLKCCYLDKPGRREAAGHGFLNSPFRCHSCNCELSSALCVLRNQGRNTDANFRENRCNIRCYWRNRGQQCGTSRSLVRLPSSLLSSSLRLPSSLLPPSLLRLIPLKNFEAATTGGLLFHVSVSPVEPEQPHRQDDHNRECDEVDSVHGVVRCLSSYFDNLRRLRRTRFP